MNYKFVSPRRKRRSKLWMSSDEDFTAVVKASFTIGEVLYHYGIYNHGGNSRTAKDRIKFLNIDISHFDCRRRSRTWSQSENWIEEVLVENCTLARGSVKRGIIKRNLITYKCALCHLTNEWNSATLVLRLDHINGVPDDCRVQNLRFLCPNCDSQQDTFAGRNRRKCNPPLHRSLHPLQQKDQNIKIDKRRISKPRPERRVTMRPDQDGIVALVNAIGFRAAGVCFGVSDKAVRKWLDKDHLKLIVDKRKNPTKKHTINSGFTSGEVASL